MKRESDLIAGFLQRCLITFAVILLLYLAVTLKELPASGIRIAAAASVLCCFTAVTPPVRKKLPASLTPERLILLCGIVLRIAYMLYTPWNVRSHDMGKAKLGQTGIAGYLLQLIQLHKMPESSAGQLYQQPLYYCLSAPVAMLLNGVIRSRVPEVMIEGAKTVSCFASCAALYAADLLCDMLSLKRQGKCCAVALFAFLPAWIMSSGALSPDALCLLNLLLMLVFSILWYRKPSAGITLCLALCSAAAMLTRNFAVAAAAAAVVMMLRKTLRTGRKTLFLTVLYVIAAFGIGLSYSCVCSVKYAQPLLYVPVGTGAGKMAAGSIFQRVFGSWEALSAPFADPSSPCALPVYLLKTLFFSDGMPKTVPVWLAWSLQVTGGVIMLFAVRESIAAVFRGNGSGRHMALLALAGMVFVLCFPLTYPMTRYMDMRYYLAAVVPAGIVLFLRQSGNRRKVLTVVLIPAYAVMSSIAMLII